MSGGEACLPCLLYYMCLCPSVNHSSWAVLPLNGYSKSTCNSSGENGYAKLFNTPLNLLGQSQLVLLHIFYPLDLLSLSWSLLPHCVKKMLIFLQCNGQGAACRFFFSWQLYSVGHSCNRLILPGGFTWPSFQVTFVFLHSTDLWANKHSLPFLSLWFPPCGCVRTVFLTYCRIFYCICYMQHSVCVAVKCTIPVTSECFNHVYH